MALISELLLMKNPGVVSVHPLASVLEAVQLMNRHRIGAVLVMDGDELVGIFTERDVLHVVGSAKSVERVRVEEVMTTNVTCATADADANDVAEIMKDRRVRHVPVIDGHRRVLGLISIGDINAHHVRQAEATIASLNDYICGRG